MPYIGRSTDGFGVRNRFLYLASASDTSVSGADANGATLTFTDGAYVDVYLNGVLLKAGTDYNTNTANTIAGLSALASNDEVTVIVYDVFTVGDMVSATSGGTFVGNVTHSGTVTFGSTVSGLDVNGTEVILDADGDTTITADTDDQIDIKIAGADDFQFTANTFTAQSGSTIAAQALTATTITTSSTVDVQGNEIILDDDGDTSITADTDDEIHFKVAGSDHVKIKGGTNVLHVIEGSSGQGTPHTNSGLVIESDGETGINILTGNTNFGGFVFGDDGDADIGFIQYKHDDNYLRFGTNTSEQMRIDSSGNVGIGTTPSSWHSNWTAIDFGDQGFIGHYDGGDTQITTNLYHDGSWKAKETGTSANYTIGAAGYHIWYGNPSASANAAVTMTKKMEIDANGIVTIPQQPAFIAYNNSNNNHTFSSAESWELLAFNVITIDKNSDFASSTFTAPVDGTYFVASHQMFNASSSGEIRHDIAIYVNSSVALYKQAKGDNYTIAKSVNIVGLLDLDASDTVKVYSRVSDTKGRIYVSQTTSTFHGYLVA